MVQPRSHSASDTVRAIQSYRVQYMNPLKVSEGDVVLVGREDNEYPGWRWCTAGDGRQGWVPVDLLGALATEGSTARMAADYDAMELSIESGDILVVTERRPDWIRVVTDDGRHGWVPATHVAPDSPRA